MLNVLNKYAFIALLKPFQQSRHINKYRGRFQISFMFHNYNNKIWCFVNHRFTVTLMKDTKQLISLYIHDQYIGTSNLVTLIYAKCDRVQRLDLWDSILSRANGNSDPWIIGGDLNLVVYASNKIGGLLVTYAETKEFKDCIENVERTQIQHKRESLYLVKWKRWA